MTVVVVGASLAGATTAATLREVGYEGEVVLLGAEEELPYERPELSKGYLAGLVTVEDLLVRPASFYDQAGIELHRGERACGVDVERRVVHLESGDALSYSSLVIATGADNVRPAIPGADRSWVHQLRTLAEADELQAQLSGATVAVVVGMGFVGCEVASTLRSLGFAVTAVDPRPGPLWDALGPEVSATVRAWHQERGVRLLSGVAVSAITADHVVLLADGTELPADVVVVGVGVRPATSWLQDVPMHLMQGAVGVDDRGRTTQPQVYAAGDVCTTWYPGATTHRRSEHWSAAVEHGQRVAREIAGVEQLPEAPPYFWSMQHGRHLQYVGQRDPEGDVVRRPDESTFFLSGGLLTGAVTVDNGRDLRRAMRLLGRPVEREALADPLCDLRELARTA